MNPQEAFLDLLIAAMTDAAKEKKLTQLQTSIGEGKERKTVRLIVIPEELEYQWPKDQPLGTDTRKN